MSKCDAFDVGLNLFVTVASMLLLLYLHQSVWTLPDVQSNIAVQVIVFVMAEAPAALTGMVSFYNLLKSITKYISCRRGYGGD